MKIILLDSETEGLPIYGTPSHDPRQPHMVQLAGLLVDTDNLNADPVSFSKIVRPQGWRIDENGPGFATHRITNERAAKEGVPLAEVLVEFDAVMMAPAQEAIGYNVDFDRRILRIASMRCWGRDRDPREKRAPIPWFCMLLSVRRAAKAAQETFSKTPKLSEAYRWAFNEEFEGAHDALADITATLRIYRYLRTRNDEIVRIKDKESF